MSPTSIQRLDLEPCIPPAWAPEGHSQTILGYMLPSNKIDSKYKTKIQICKIPLDDEDILVAEWISGKSDTLILLFHGLTGDSQSDYIQRMGQYFLDQGHSVLLVNHRGCGLGKGLAKHPYHSGSAKDISAVIQYSRTKFPNLRQIAIGFSLSGNALLLALSDRHKAHPDFAISVNPPVDLSKTSLQLQRGLNKIYDLQFVMKCCADVKFKEKLKMIGEDTYCISRFKSLRDFDAKYTSIAGGFLSREDYYEKCSTYNKFQNITTPTLIISAKDDPFIPASCYATSLFGLHVKFHLENVGGHMGYLSSKKTPLNSIRWMDYALSEYVSSLI